MKLIDGKIVAEAKKKVLAAAVMAMIDEGKPAPHLVAVIVGDDPASLTYVKSKEKTAHSVGMTSSTYRYPSTIRESELLQVIDFLNKDEEVDGYIVQLPLPEHLSSTRIIERINPAKDVDGFHPTNTGRMVQNLPCYLPATPYGIMQLLEYYHIETDGKHCVVLGRSQIVGTPMALLLSRKAKPGNCTVTICHSQTKNLAEITRTADILVAAIGKAEFVTADMVKEGAVVIDVGIHRIGSKEEGTQRIIGDVKFDEVSKKASWITPVPGGVGPMTIISLLTNTLKAARKEIYT
ncbi:MAG: bifunctional 5,10-methylenetetrahydrofolate dehydrogenase/5,10-methenyltetrahydrofolate cyclohydrolase [Bacteroidales bacterium]|nr:bifunctional 5,10-methylenetetrahydrofolate dehydrogenase/5,10-methenyltetrahydrofolate cyclohydrolase [Bacteroidales bacterium]MDZ4204781.1 bifunctional 5,10-methylenetetrahydrofolate dehydrogenase/5,10-methenyltetrahydrofolate cyclohydrolase [Bacteroidales bacterium]